jgi:hypothetical protein
VLIRHGQQKALKALFYQLCILFIDKECRWLYKKMQIASILKQHVTIKESFSKLGVLSSLPPFL